MKDLTDGWKTVDASMLKLALVSTAAERALNAPADRDVLREALETIVEMHNAFCEHHVGVQSHSHELADIAERALAAAPTPPAEPARKPLFAELIASHEGLSEELKAMDAAPATYRIRNPENGAIWFTEARNQAENSRESGREVTPLYTYPAPDVLAKLRAEVEGLHSPRLGNSNATIFRADVLALIDKMGGTV